MKRLALSKLSRFLLINRFGDPGLNKMLRLLSPKWLGLTVIVAVAGCAFDLSHVKQMPVTFTPAGTEPGQSFVLGEEVKAHLGTGYPTRLKSGTKWHPVGKTEYG